MKKKLSPLPPMANNVPIKRTINSMDRIMTGSSASSNQSDGRKYRLPEISKPLALPPQRNFMLSISDKKKPKQRPSSLIRNSSQDPFGPMSPLRTKIQKFKLAKLENIKQNVVLNTEKKMKTINSHQNLLNNDKENISQNVRDQEQNLYDGFNATFSKHGSISCANQPLQISTNRETKINPEIEIKQLEQSSEESDFNRSETEISH